MAEVAADGDLLDPGLLRRLESLRMVSRRLSRSSLRGERRSRARGYSIEFADYRNYVEGDDLRYLDWNLYGRLDRLFLRLFEEDRELPVSIFLDCSESMNFGTPLKFDFARRVAAAIAHVALHGGDRVGVHPFPRRPENEALRLPLSRVRGGRSSLRLAGDLARLSCGGGSELNAELRRGALEVRTAGLAVVVSDLLCHGGYQQGIQALLSRRFQVALVQVLSPEELSPGRFGDLKFVDAETGAVQEATFGRYRLARYQATVAAYQERLAEHCRKRGVGFWPASSDSSLEDLLLRQMRQGEFWR